MAPWVNALGATLKVYNVNDTPPRAPVYTSAMVLQERQATTSDTPTEAAVCLSFQGVPISGVPQARHRGRAFIGGLAAPLTAGDLDSFPVVNADLQSSMATAGDDFRIATAAAGWVWVVFSRVLNTGSAITNGWIDNALDTQRRRGNDPTSRLVWP
jgi:hypothetical protein